MLSLIRATCPALRPQLFQRPGVQAAARWYSEQASSQQASATVSPIPQMGWTQPVVEAAQQLAELPTKTPEAIWAERSEAAHRNAAAWPPANAYSGRSVTVINGELSQAFNKLSTILAKNKVRQQLKLAERHEKRGVKRRRLSSERWRRRFSEEVRKKVQLVEQIRIRGA